MYKMFYALFISISLLAVSCGGNNAPANPNPVAGDSSFSKSSITLPDSSAFRDTVDGKPTALYVLKNKNNMEAAITNYGARVVSLLVPDKDGVPTDVVLGYDSIGKYVHGPESFFGAIVGRYGNRIAKGKFKLEGRTYSLAINNPPNSLHGGKKGFGAVVWDAKRLSGSSVELNYLSRDKEEGYPGNLQVKVIYTLTDSNELKIDYIARTDKATVLNLTNHSYFNLNGQGNGTIEGHLLQINGQLYTPIDSTLIPTGKLEPVAGTPMDFRQPMTIGSRINTDNTQLKYGKGYDHNFSLDSGPDSAEVVKYVPMRNAATVVGDKSGITMDVFTQEPGIQFYSGNFMAGKNTLKNGKKDDHRGAFCLETQHYPDSPNQPSFPSTELKPGKVYQTETVFKFSVKK